MQCVNFSFYYPTGIIWVVILHWKIAWADFKPQHLSPLTSSKIILSPSFSISVGNAASLLQHALIFQYWWSIWLHIPPILWLIFLYVYYLPDTLSDRWQMKSNRCFCVQDINFCKKKNLVFMSVFNNSFNERTKNNTDKLLPCWMHFDNL